MIPAMHITAWARHAPWAEQRQIEQDLIISRAIVALFADPFLGRQLRFRGGTALNKLHFPEPLRYSEDIDLVRTSHGPIKPVINAVRESLEPWLGKPAFRQSPIAPKLIFSVPAEDGGQIGLKLEINTRECEVYDQDVHYLYGVENPWFSGECTVSTFSNEEMLATKLRALLQRDKGRDLFDIAHGLTVMEPLDTTRIADLFKKYLEKSDQLISRAQAEQRMFRKLARPNFLADVRPLVRADQVRQFDQSATNNAFRLVFGKLISQIAGQPWAKTGEMKQRFGLLDEFD